ncbi:MAG: hypothetical protein R3B40_24775 [Polyangiales bacterium]|nr:hypothetical protein [Myxococcales bacterium]MCB9659597.1 hypothetical protein [Sandaracinaceae bacterium]
MTTPRQSMPETREALQERARVVELERQRLVQLRDAAVRDRNNAAKLSVLVILAVPAFVFWGFWIALAVVIQVILLVVGTWYITGVHILEYNGNLVDCEHDQVLIKELLGRVEAGAGQDAAG